MPRVIRPLRRTHTYSILEVAPATAEDLKRRLIEADVLQFYTDTDDDGQELIVFGITALRVEAQSS